MTSLDDAELVDALDAHQRLTNVHQAQQLALIGELDARRATERRDCRNGLDICARRQTVTEVAAAISEGECHTEHLLRVARLLRDRLHRTADLLALGRISRAQAIAVADC
ncbi:MAG: hypothetical protein ACRDOJ_07315, partial [Nocardioidaceae bacterium]